MCLELANPTVLGLVLFRFVPSICVDTWVRVTTELVRSFDTGILRDNRQFRSYRQYHTTVTSNRKSNTPPLQSLYTMKIKTFFSLKYT